MSSLLMIVPSLSDDAMFIQHELPCLAGKFDKVHILCFSKQDSKSAFLQLPKNVFLKTDNLKWGKLKKIISIVFVMLNKSFYRELYIINRNKKMSLSTIFSMVNFLVSSLALKKSIVKVLKEDQNIGILYTYWYSQIAMAALFAKKNKNSIKCVTRTHGADLYEFRNKQNYQPFKTWMDKRLDKIFFISQHGYDYYIKTFKNSDLSKYVISRLGVINEYGIEKECLGKSSFAIVSCAFISPVKRIDLIIEALAAIDEIDIRWVHIGDGIEKEKIMNLAKKLLSEKNNISCCFKGFMTNDLIMKYYSENYFDCFVSVSESEGLPVSMMEAASFGMPIIATNVGGVSEIVSDMNGILLDANCSSLDIKNALLEYYNYSKDKKTSLRSYSRLLWEAKYNASNNFEAFAEELSNLDNSG